MVGVGNFDGFFEDGEKTAAVAIARRIVIVVGIARGAITAVSRVGLTSIHVLIYWCVELDWIGRLW